MSEGPLRPIDKSTDTSEREIIATAASLPEEERIAFLDKACAGQQALRDRAEAFLRAHECTAFMDSSPEAAGNFRAQVTERPRSERSGDQIGPYKLCEQIGEGGFGTVWMAEQAQPVRRQVALKIIKQGMDTKEVIARFEQERQALAMMDHPHIAKVFDAGATELGRPFFVMELVRGVKITDYCDEANLPTPERLALFIQVCNAVQHAHQKGIIHRDLKPSNILVALHDGTPMPKIIDFGVAKATQELRLTELTIHTQIQQMIGTPLYMSPEQAEIGGSDIDTRSDIYSLGVLLYELLTGRTPFDPEELMRKGYEEMRRVIREEEPKKPSTALQTMAPDLRTRVAQRRQEDAAKMAGLLRGDLDWIVMKAIEKDRTRRYETANWLSVDIQRFLLNETVSARPPSATYRFQKFARRNKLALGIATMVAVVLSVATGISLWQAKIAIAAKKEATKRAEESDAIATFLTSIFQSADPLRDGRSITVVEILGRAARELEADVSIDAERKAKMQSYLSNTYRSLGLPNEGIPLQEQLRDYLASTLGAEHPETLNALHNLARLYADVGRRDEALIIQERVRALLGKILGPEHSDTLQAIEDLSISYFAAGRQQEAIAMLERVLAVQRKLHGALDPNVVMDMNNLASFYEAAGRPADALEMREKVLELRLKAGSREHPNTLMAIGNLAISYAHAGRREEAIKMTEEMLPLCRKVFGPENVYTLIAMVNLADYYADAGHHDKAIELYERAVEGFRKQNGSEDPNTLTAIDALARSYFSVGRHDEAIALQEQILQTSKKINGRDHRDTFRIQLNLADSYFGVDRRDEALELRLSARDGFLKADGEDHPHTIIAMSDLADSYFAAGSHDEALQLRIKVMTTRRRTQGKDNPDTLKAMTALAESYDAVGQSPEAKALRDEVTAVMAKPSAR
jgi:serine/threonine protein kinase